LASWVCAWLEAIGLIAGIGTQVLCKIDSVCRKVDVRLDDHYPSECLIVYVI
jgi:hypothetical protein